ncbi:hypothetical protein BDP27DRAFT_1264081 [Rhodocollybia butyracea]|uniref:Trichome birefringence-like C-terminal domain-containing protein n=1 Tax=Rhodocollybia butyracea TaxID=206335 RepID=A0A9P5P5B8_9AGAR|nr:hypothetical protein BDP27DRAFT_1306394 [Rhodocollybia butyracea]KAF9070123.1 hypothetical protein BDP27DRAFT_1264081 [Rhodocollybia butyracea]
MSPSSSMQRSKLRVISLFLVSVFVLVSVHQQLSDWINSRSFKERPLFDFDFPEDTYHDTQETEAPYNAHDPDDNVVVLPPVTQLPFLCQSYECAVGKWVPRREKFTSLEHVQTVYSNLYHPVWSGCGVGEPPEDEEEKKRLEGQKLVDTMNWEWVPDRGMLLEYDPVEFVVRLLKSPGGLVLVGDSISRQHWHAMYYTWRHLNITFDSNPPHLPLAGVANVEQFVLSKSSPMTKILQEKAGVPQSRMERPFFTLLEDHMLLHQPDIRAITGAKPTYKWIHKYKMVDGWEDHLKWLAMPREEEKSSVTEDTLVLINAGAHWSRHELGMLRAPTNAEEQVLLEAVYPQMIDLVTSRLSPIERTSIYYRSTSPGHPTCKDHFMPYTDMAHARLQEKGLVHRLQETVVSSDDKKQRSRWDWDMFKPHNEMWNQTIDSMTEKRSPESKNAKWYYFDIWDLSMQRPDAHLNPGQDCLHWCLPAVFDDWTKLFVHRVNLEESRADLKVLG